MNAKTVTPPAAQTQTAQPAAIARAQQAQGPSFPNPFQKTVDQRTVAGVVAIESERAVAEAQGKLVLAKRFPRDPFLCFERMRSACMRPGLAAEAFYEFPRGGSTVRGPSIRLAEELALCWGNFEYGQKELSNDSETHTTEMQAFAWDLETNTISTQQFTVRHIRDTQGGGKTLTDQRDIYEIGANMGARRMRSRILAMLPADYVDAAVQLCTETVKKTEGPLADRAKKLITAFAPYGVTPAAIEQRIGHAIASVTEDDFVAMRGILTALRDGAKAADFFGAPEVAAPAPAAQPVAAASAPAQTAAPQAQAKPPTTTPPAAQPAATAKAEAPKAEVKAPPSTAAPATTNAPAPAADAKPPKGKRKMLIEDVNPTTGEVTQKPAPEGEAPATEAPAAEAPAAAETAPPQGEAPASPINEADDDIFR